MNSAAIFLITIVSVLCRALGWRACRFYPSCSVYGTAAFEQFNFFKALMLTVKRILRCHPFSRGGFDPVPVELKER